jgi:copper(I)-binding protein
VKLNPGGTHVWLADLRRPLKTDDSFTLTLRFEKAGERQVAVSVVAPTTLPLM